MRPSRSPGPRSPTEFAASASPPTAEDTRRLDFADGTFAGWNIKRLAHARSARLQSEIVRNSPYAARVELRPGDFVSEGYRAELSDNYNAPIGRDLWYGFSSYVPTDYPIADGAVCVLAQWHDQVELGTESGKPMLAHRYRNGRFYVTHDGHGIAQMVLYEDNGFARGRWYDFVYHVLWTPEEDGYIDGWIDGRAVVRFRGSTMYPGRIRGPYFKFGVYCPDGVSTPHVAYHGEYSRGGSLAQVDPAGPAAAAAKPGG